MLDILILVILIIWIIISARFIIKSHKAGGCANCPHFSECQNKDLSKKNCSNE